MAFRMHVLLHHNGVRTPRQGGAGKNSGARSALDWNRGLGTCRNMSDDLQSNPEMRSDPRHRGEAPVPNQADGPRQGCARELLPIATWPDCGRAMFKAE